MKLLDAKQVKSIFTPTHVSEEPSSPPQGRELAQMIRLFCEEKDIAMTTFFKRIGRSSTNIRNWEEGKCEPSKEAVNQVLDILDGRTNIRNGQKRKGTTKKTVLKKETKAIDTDLIQSIMLSNLPTQHKNSLILLLIQS